MTVKDKTLITRQLLLSGLIVGLFALVCVLMSGKAHSASQDVPAPASTASVTVSPEGAKAADIEVAAVRSQALQDTIHTSGQILYSPDLTIKISPRLQGRVKQVCVRVGDHVTAGQMLAVLDSVDAATARTTAQQNENKLRLAKSSLDRAERQFRLGTPEVTQAQATLDQAKVSVQTANDVLDHTRQQATIGGFTQKPVEDAENALVAARSSLSQAQADLNMAQKDYVRKVKLVEIGVAAKSDLEVSQDSLEKAKVNVQAGQDTVMLAQQALDREQKAFKTNLYADQQVHQAEASYQQALLQQQAAERALLLAKAAIRATLEQAKSDYQSAQFDAQNSRQQLALLGQPGPDGTLIIRSPLTGVVTERFVGPGQVVDQSQMTPWQMFTLANTDQVWVEADVYEKDLSLVTEGSPVHIHVAALPDRTFTGTVLHIAPALDKTSRALKVRAEINNRSGLLKDGMYANVDILLPQGHPEIVIPLAAVEHDEDSDYVYLADKGKYVQRLIHLRGQKDGNAIVDSGLKLGEQIVTHGALYLGSQASGD
jgi:RND family efflux transporter MFP subunit